MDEVRYSSKEEEKEEKRQSSQCVKVSLIRAWQCLRATSLRLHYTDFVITARSAAPIPDLLVLYTMLYYAFRDPLLDFTVNPRDSHLLSFKPIK